MTKTDNDRVKVVAWVVIDSGYPYLHWPGEVNVNNIKATPLISALDEADAVDGLCGYLGFCPARDTTIEGAKTCGSKCHAHADKLRRLQ